MRVLVTGGARFIGSAVCRHFIVDLGYDVVVVDKLTYAGNLASLEPVQTSPRYALEKHDICDRAAMAAISLSTGRMLSCISPPKATSIARFPAPTFLCRPM